MRATTADSMWKSVLALPAAVREAVARATLTQGHHTGRKDENEDAMALLSESDGEEDHHEHRRPSNKFDLPVRLRTRFTAIALCLVALILGFWVWSASPTSRPMPETSVDLEDGLPQKDYFFHILLPTINTSAEFCKTLLSAAVLNYPSPWLMTWDDESTEDPTLLKLQAVSGWLDNMEPERDDDPVLVLGDVHAWFQVRTEVILRRYLSIQERGDRHIQTLFSHETIEEHDLRAKIVFASEKECHITREKQNGCLATAAEDGSLHYLSNNVVMGSIKDLRPLIRHALERAERLASKDIIIDETDIFAQILGEQDVQRESLRKQANESIELPAKAPIAGAREDFGITLDFGRQLAYAADEHLEGVDWVEHTDHNPAHPVPEDIADSTPPFWTFAASGELPHHRTWADVPFLTGLHANIVPAIIQRGPTAPSTLSTSWYDKLWFQPHARLLLDAFAFIPSFPLAVIEKDDEELRFWSPHFEKVGAKDAALEWHDWNELCVPEDEERAEEVAQKVFGDGKGVWVDPRP